MQIVDIAKGTIPDELFEYVEEEVQKNKYQLLSIAAKGRGFEIVIDVDGGITVAQCVRFNRKVSSWMEENNILKGNVYLDVCSPGLDRNLKTKGDFLWAIGRQVKVSIQEQVAGKLEYVGLLNDFEGAEDIVLECGEEQVSLQKKIITSVRVCVSEEQ